ncbi:MAG: hypothetical protein H6835_04375 [Planctomycetes bacterium]|nr:hypothetical protein [Planctomycetota bacterium]
MFGWFRRKKPNDREGLSRQHWARGLTRKQQDRVERLALEHLRRRSPTAAFDDGVAQAGELQFGLENLAQICAHAPADDWPEIVDGHFARMQRSEEEAAEWEVHSGTFAWAIEQLRLRLYPDNMLGADKMVARQDLPGVLTALVADRPSMLVTVSDELFVRWGRSREEVFARALEQTLAHEPVELEWLELPGEPVMRVAFLGGEGLCATAHVLRLEAWPELLGAHGALCAVPNRHSVLVAPIDGASIVALSQRLVGLAVQGCAAGPGSITPSLYWRRPDGRFDVQRVEPGEPGKSVRFFPSPGFVELLNRLQREP